jgi:hypothetical protein
MICRRSDLVGQLAQEIGYL